MIEIEEDAPKDLIKVTHFGGPGCVQIRWRSHHLHHPFNYQPFDEAHAHARHERTNNIEIPSRLSIRTRSILQPSIMCDRHVCTSYTSDEKQPSICISIQPSSTIHLQLHNQRPAISSHPSSPSSASKLQPSKAAPSPSGGCHQRHQLPTSTRAAHHPTDSPARA